MYLIGGGGGSSANSYGKFYFLFPDSCEILFRNDSPALNPICDVHV